MNIVLDLQRLENVRARGSEEFFSTVSESCL